MEPFFTNLQQLRNQRGVDLAEVANRTKISIRFLESIEEGRFDFLPTVYVRLFLRAYCQEIGADPAEALKHFDELLTGSEGHRESRPQPKEPVPTREEIPIAPFAPPLPKPEKSAKEKRSDWIKTGVMVLVLVFAIYILQKITARTADPAPASPTSVNLPPTSEKLRDQYVPHESTRNWTTDRPLQFTLSAIQPVWYRVITDANSPEDSILESGVLTASYDSTVFIRLDNSSRGKLSLNNRTVPLDDLAYPVDLSFSATTGFLTVTQYTPK